jgi:hypothetical protein
MSDNTAHVTQVMNAGIDHLVKSGVPVTLENHYHTILGWYLAWKSVATTPTDHELVDALEIAHDRLYCKLINIQY